MEIEQTLRPYQNGSPTVSVIMPVYNCAPFLRQAIQSILDQTWRDFELIVVNDGSTDESAVILAEFAACDPRIVVVTLENQGIVVALNEGLAVARGKYVARMDGDDISMPERIEKQVILLERDPRIIVCGSNARTFGAYSATLHMPVNDRACKRLLLSQPCFIHPTVMMRRDALKLGLYELEYQFAEDYRLWSVLASQGRFANLPEVLLMYRIHPGQVATRKQKIQKAIHEKIAHENLGSAGILIDAKRLQVVLWPNESMNHLRYSLVVVLFLLKLLVHRKLAAKTASRCLRHVARSA